MTFMHPMPESELQVRMYAIVLGHISALRDYPLGLDASEIKLHNLASDSCEKLQKAEELEGQLQNYFTQFRDMFISEFVFFYRHKQQHYKTHREEYMQERATLEREGYLTCFALQYAELNKGIQKMKDMSLL